MHPKNNPDHDLLFRQEILSQAAFVTKWINEFDLKRADAAFLKNSPKNSFLPAYSKRDKAHSTLDSFNFPNGNNISIDKSIEGYSLQKTILSPKPRKLS